MASTGTVFLCSSSASGASLIRALVCEAVLSLAVRPVVLGDDSSPALENKGYGCCSASWLIASGPPSAQHEVRVPSHYHGRRKWELRTAPCFACMQSFAGAADRPQREFFPPFRAWTRVASLRPCHSVNSHLFILRELIVQHGFNLSSRRH